MSFNSDNFKEYCRKNVNRFVNVLQTSNEERVYKTACELQQYICNEMQTLNSNETMFFVEELCTNIFCCLNQNDQDKRGLILAIIILVSVDISNNKIICSRAANSLRNLEVVETESMELIAYAIGKIAIASGSITDSYVDFEISQAFENISEDSNESKKHFGILILKELAISTPNCFIKYIERFFEVIFNPIIKNQNQNKLIQENAINALKAVLYIICKNETKEKQIQYFQLCFKNAFNILEKSYTVKQNSKDKIIREDRTHGAFLILNELLKCANANFEKLRNNLDEIIYQQSVFESSKSKYQVIREWGEISINQSYRQFIHDCSKAYLNNDLKTILEFHKKMSFVPNDLPEIRVLPSADSIHCKKLVITHFDKLIKYILREKESTSSSIQKSVLMLISRLSTYENFFKDGYFDEAIQHTLELSAKKIKERSYVLITLGFLCCVPKNYIKKYIPKIIQVLKSYLQNKEIFSRKKNLSVESSVIQSVSLIAQSSISFEIKDDLRELIDPLMNSGLSPSLNATLFTICEKIPELQNEIHEKLFQVLFSILFKWKYIHSGDPKNRLIDNKNIQIPLNETNLDSHIIVLSLRMFGQFNFSYKHLIQLFYYNIHNYILNNKEEIRLEAVKTCFKLLNKLLKEFNLNFSLTLVSLIQSVLNQILLIATTNSSPRIRYQILASLNNNFDKFLTQSNHVTRLFVCINDEVFEIRELAIFTLGRLSDLNPAFIKPKLRLLLIELLNNLENSNSRLYKEQSTRMLSHIITTSPKFASQYASTILDILTSILKDKEITNNYMTTVLYTIGLQARISEDKVKNYLHILFPILLDIIQDSSYSFKREVGLWTLGQIIDVSGCVVDPYWKYKNLLDVLLNIFKTEQSIYIRREATKVLGLLGALDPYEHKIKIGIIDQSGNDYITDDINQLDTQDLNNAEILVNISSSLENFYLAIAVTNMLKIIKDPSLLTHHIAAIEGINFMFITFTSKCIPFIHQIFPLYLSLIKNADNQIREAIFCQLCSLIPIVKDHIKKYLEQLFNFIKEYWETTYHQISLITLVEQIAVSLKTDFKQNLLPKILPDILKSFYNDKSNDKQVTLKLLSLIQKFDDNSYDFLNLILPEIIKIFENKDYSILVRKRALTIIKTLSDNLDLSNYYSMIMQPAIRVYRLKPESNELKDALSDLIYSLVNKYELDKEMMEKLLLQNNIEFRKEPPYQDKDNEVYKTSRKTTRGGRVSTTKKPMMFTSTLEKAFSPNFSTDIQWNDYIKVIFNDLLNDTPSTALKACLNIFRSYEQLPKDVFNVAFFSCWIELNADQHKKIIQDLEKILQNDKIPEMISVILNLVEFMDHTEYEFPIDLNLLSETAVKHRVYAKALRFRENEFQKSQSCKVLESLISINNKLRQSSAVSGILKYAAKNHEIDFKVKEQWHEKLHNWENALKAYQLKQEANPSDIQSTIGQMRCLEMLGEWEDLYKLSLENWSKVGEEYQGKIARMCAAAAWSLNKWDHMEMYTEHIRHNTYDYPFYKAVLEIHKKNYQTAQNLIDHARDNIDSHLTAMVGESQDRAYGAMVSVMLFSELEEVIQYKILPEKCDLIRKKWWDRLQGCQKIVEDWQKILRVHSLVLTQYEDRKAWLKFASICQKFGRLKLSQRILVMLMKEDNNEIALNLDKELSIHNIGLEYPSKVFSILTELKINNDPILFHINCPEIAYGFIKHLWRINEHDRAYCFLQLFFYRLENKIAKLKKLEERKMNGTNFIEQVDSPSLKNKIKKLLSKCCSKISYWTEAIYGLNEKSIKIMLTYFATSVTYDSNWYKAWNSYALCNFKAISFYCNKLQVTNNNLEPDTKDENIKEIRINDYAIAAIKGFFKSISLSHGSSLQDTLRLLTILFDEGNDKEVSEAFIEGSQTVPIETWLQVIPQLIARIDTYRPLVCQITQQLLIDVSKCHPQALIYSLTVAQKSSVPLRQIAANRILKTMSEHSSNLVTQALLVSDELIRVSILWHELWHDGLEEASRLYFGDKNVKAMLDMLEPLHKHLERGPNTFKEMSFKKAFGNDLAQARQYCRKFLLTGDVKNVTQAWEFYYHVFKKISKQLPNLTTLELQYVSPKLLCCRDLELAVPGIYHPNKPVVKIARIESDLQVITSKQRPRKLCIKGSNGKDFMFLLKGHEDLRQDERVMQLFGLVNSILANSYETSRRNLAIQRYAVIPLSHNSGLIGWVPHCDTLHTLIKDYRNKNKTLLNIEHRIMLRMAPNFDRLTIMQKVEIFEMALDSTQGDDIHCLLWNKSPTSEIWFERRTNYIRSLAVMSMVGYILGLGDRHPSNLMIDRLTGKVLHIDFGDCFEVAMARDKFPEKIPFRLTRMLIKAMEITGIEGTYKITCEKVLKVLRHNKDSLMAVLEAFVYDPLLNWGLTETTTTTYSKNSSIKLNNFYNTDLIDSVANELDIGSFTNYQGHPLQHEAISTTSNIDFTNDTKFSNHECLNKKALVVVNRILDKLTGHDFDKNICLDVLRQVELLIKQATSNENLCQLYIGWCPFW